MKQIASYIALAALALLPACEDTPQKRYEKIAAGFCECTNQLAALNKEAVALADDTTGRAAEVFRRMQAEYVKAKECSAAIIGQYGKLKPTEFDEVQAMLDGRCPEMAEQRDLLQEMLGE